MAASFEMKITKDGSTLVELTDDTKYLIDQPFHMKAKAPDVPTTKESLNLIVLGSDYATARGNLNDLVDAIKQAQNFWDHPGYGDEPVYVEVKIESSDDWYRSLLHPESEVTDIDIDVANLNAKIPCRLNIVRDNYWEGEEKTLSVSNDAPSNQITFFNPSPVTACNWHVYTAQTGFDLPSPLKIYFTNNKFGVTVLETLIISNLEVLSTAGLEYFFEAEDGSGDGTNIVDASGSSGGYYRQFMLNSDAIQSLKIDLIAAGIKFFANRHLMPILRFSDLTDVGNVQIRFRLTCTYDPTSEKTIYQSEWQTINSNNYVQRFSVFPFSAAPKITFSAYESLYFVIDLKRTTSSTEYIEIDFIELFFAETSLVINRGPNPNLLPGDGLHVMPYDPYVDGYAVNGTTPISNWIVLGQNSLFIKPNVPGFLVYAWSPTYGGIISEELSGFIYKYRPRRLTL